MQTECCSHIKPEDFAECPFQCKTWLNPFPWTSTNARFESDNIIDFIELNENIPEINRLFKSLDLVFDRSLYKICDNLKTNCGESDWKTELLETLTSIKSLHSLNSKELDVFKKLMADRLFDNIHEHKNRMIPNVLLITPNEIDDTLNAKLVYNSCNKKKQPLTFQDFALIHKAMPNLKCINIDSLNIQVSGEEEVVVPNNDLESIRINLADRIDNPTNLIIFLLQSYHWTVKDFKLEIEDGKIKQQEMIDDGKRLETSFGEISFQFDNLESLEINNFYKSINIGMLLSKLGTTNCKLKKIRLLGQSDAEKVFYYAVKDHCYSLNSLSVSGYQYSPINILSRLTGLEKFSYKWDSLNEQVDIFKILTTLPKLKYLELGHIRIQGDWVTNVVTSSIYENLNTLSLSNVNIKQDSFKNLNQQLPNLKNIILTACRIGKSRYDIESTIDFGDYNLDTFVLDNCKLFHPRKELKPKGRCVTRFFLSMHYHEPYATTIKHKYHDESSKSKLYIENEYFVYDISESFPAISNNNILYIKANLIRSFSLSCTPSEYVTFCPESEIEKAVEDSNQSPTTEVDTALDSDIQAEVQTEIYALDDSENENQDNDMGDLDDTYNVTMEDVSMITGIELSETIKTTELDSEEQVEITESIEKVITSSTIKDVANNIELLNEEDDIPDIPNSNKEYKANTLVIDKGEESLQEEIEKENQVFVIPESDDDEEKPLKNVDNDSEFVEPTKERCFVSRLFTPTDEEESLPDAPQEDTESVEEDAESVQDEAQSIHNDTESENEEDLQDNSDENDLLYSDNEGTKSVDTCSDEDYTNESDSETQLRKSPRKRIALTRSMTTSDRKRVKIIDSSKKEDEEVYSRLLSRFVDNCREYKAVIRIPARNTSS